MEESKTTLSATSCNVALQTAESPRMSDLSPLVVHPAKQHALVSEFCTNTIATVNYCRM